jgi:hypothetical protein
LFRPVSISTTLDTTLLGASVAAKRFTDITKWRNGWFRGLSDRAKLVWIYLCDECDFTGIWKADYELASFQLNFKVTKQHLVDWYGDKLHFFGVDNVLILKFFEFQYGESKDTWTAKSKAKQRLESLGFTIANNSIVKPQTDDSTTTVVDSPKNVLSVGVGVIEGVGVGNKGGVGEKTPILDFEALYAMYPKKEGKTKGIEKLKATIHDAETYSRFAAAVARYINHLKKNKTEPKYIKQFSTFVNTWPDWDDPNAGSSIVTNKKYENEREVDHDAEMKEIWGLK